MSWTDERIALLKKMWKEGKSAAEIAKTLGKGVTRNAVIGKAHRMGLSGRPSPIKKPAPAKKEPASKKTPASPPAPAAPRAAASGKKSAAPKTNPALAREAEEMKTIQKEVVPPGGGVALIDLTERMCKWPIGDPREPDFTFCGRANRTNTPYCAEHAAMAYQTSSRSRNAAAAAAASRVKEVEEVDVDVDEDADDEELGD